MSCSDATWYSLMVDGVGYGPKCDVGNMRKNELRMSESFQRTESHQAMLRPNLAVTISYVLVFATSFYSAAVTALAVANVSLHTILELSLPSFQAPDPLHLFNPSLRPLQIWISPLLVHLRVLRLPTMDINATHCRYSIYYAPQLS